MDARIDKQSDYTATSQKAVWTVLRASLDNGTIGD